MQLTTMLIIVVSILSLLSGVSVLAGSNKKERAVAVWFLLIAIGATIWALSVNAFLGVSAGNDELAMKFVLCIFVGSIIAMTALAGHTSWRTSIGKIATSILIIIDVILIWLVLFTPELLFASVSLSNSGNIVHFLIGPYSIMYGCLIFTCAAMAIFSLVYQIKHANRKKERNGNIVYLSCTLVPVVCSLIFDLLLPMMGQCSLMWIGPVAVGVMMLGYYYSILRYRLIALSFRWLRIFSYIVLVASVAMIYMIIFYIVFTAMFRGRTPSSEVILLNFIMILIFLLLVPTINEMSAFLNSLTATRQIDMAYIIKKLNRLATKNVDLKELAGFLAEHLHFTYVGFLINGHLYGSSSTNFTLEDLEAISKLHSTEHGVWQTPTERVNRAFVEQDMGAVAELRNGKGKTFGQIIIGRPINKKQLERHDLAQAEMIINIVATIIDSRKHLGK